MIPGSLARRYAKALIQLAGSPTQRELFARHLASFVNSYGTSDGMGSTLGAVLESERFLPSQRRKVLEVVCQRQRLDPIVGRFLDYVLERGRISGIKQIHRHYSELNDELAGRMKAELISARPLGPAAVARIKDALERSTGKEIVVESSIDPTLIGGVVAKVGSTVLDGSVRTSLANLQQTLRGS